MMFITILIHQVRSATSPRPRVSRVSSTSRIPSQDHIQQPHAKQVQPTAPLKKPGPDGKTDFTLSTSVGTDEDEWVSSESGAATPGDSCDRGGGTPVDHRLLQINADAIAGTTPRAAPSINRVETARPSQPSQPLVSRTEPSSPVQPVRSPAFTSTKPKGDSRSEMHVRMHGETPAQPRPGRSSAMGSLTRRSSAYSDYVSEASSHPLIRQTLSRGQSYHSIVKPQALAPLTVNAEAAQAEISSSPPPSARTERTANSPTAFFSPSRTQSPKPAYSHNSQYARSSRRTSFSSAHSIQKLPVTSLSRGNATALTPRDRNRTISTTSAASITAISSLSHLPAMSRPGSPPLVTHFPPEDSVGDYCHPLVPVAYVANHMTVLAHYSPLPESYERVMRARARR